MLTKVKLLLVVPRRIISALTYEALEEINSLDQVETVWNHNKTPMIETEIYEDLNDQNKYLVAHAPEYDYGPEFFTTWCHNLGIECGEFMTGSKYNTFKDRCFLCDAGGHRVAEKVLSSLEFNIQTSIFHDMIIMESTHFFTKVELGCMIKGMLMINPKEHILSAAAINDNLIAEYEQMKKDVEVLLKRTYGDKPVIFFEHGSNPSGISSHQRSIVHAHTHVAWGVPFPEKYLKMVSLKPISDIRKLRGIKYMSYQEGSTGQLLAVSDPEVYVQRQYPRQVIAELSHIPNQLSNWRVSPFEKEMAETLSDFYLSLMEQDFPERILQQTEAFIKAFPYRIDIQELL